MIATIDASETKKCSWCCRVKEGVSAKFPDGLQGFLCWGDFRRAIKNRTSPTPPPSPIGDEKAKAAK